MPDAVISVENLGKKYVLGAVRQERYVALRDVLAHRFSGLFRRSTAPTIPPEEFWALKDVSFEVQPGEVVGIIGRNGAGKSTLLKVLSRITEPTRGRVTIEGRVASLLEVGTGFHPELTGRENIYLNGAILGMSRVEIKRKFDEIVAFAEVEKFLDTPVKRYSSGMYVRLAFAVAAHLEPEILIIDEVLAVGDAEFQKKCLGKMQDISTREGRTVLFVSHNMAAVSQLCDRCLVLNGGKIQVDDKTAVGVASYLRGGALDCAEIQWEAMEAPGGESMRLRRVRLCQPPGVPNASINLAEAFEVEIETEVLRLLAEAAVGIKLLSAQGQILLHTFDLLENQRGHLQPGLFVHVCTFPAHLLNAGSYSLTVAADIPHVQVLFVAENILSWRVHNFTEKVSRYGADAFKGFIGPGLAQWRLSDKIGLTHEE